MAKGDILTKLRRMMDEHREVVIAHGLAPNSGVNKKEVITPARRGIVSIYHGLNRLITALNQAEEALIRQSVNQYASSVLIVRMELASIIYECFSIAHFMGESGDGLARSIFSSYREEAPHGPVFNEDQWRFFKENAWELFIHYGQLDGDLFDAEVTRLVKCGTHNAAIRLAAITADCMQLLDSMGCDWEDDFHALVQSKWSMFCKDVDEVDACIAKHKKLNGDTYEFEVKGDEPFLTVVATDTAGRAMKVRPDNWEGPTLANTVPEDAFKD